MKRKANLPQPEFGFAHEPMKLVGDTTTDGDRVTAEQSNKDEAQRSGDRSQWWFHQAHQLVNNAPEIKPYQHLQNKL